MPCRAFTALCNFLPQTRFSSRIVDMQRVRLPLLSLLDTALRLIRFLHSSDIVPSSSALHFLFLRRIDLLSTAACVDIAAFAAARLSRARLIPSFSPFISSPTRA